MLRWVVNVKVVSTWMVGSKAGLQLFNPHIHQLQYTVYSDTSQSEPAVTYLEISHL